MNDFYDDEDSIELMPCHDMREGCFGRSVWGKCKILTSTYPEGKQCPFFKTKDDRKRELDERFRKMLLS